MNEKDIIENAVKLKNQDETERLAMKQKSVDAQFDSPRLKSKDLLYEESNRVAKEIADSAEKEKRED